MSSIAPSHSNDRLLDQLSKQSLSNIGLKGLTIVLAFLWMLTLGSGVLVNSDEARYSEIPREMSVSGDWVTPRLNDLKYFEKPILQYWATAAAYRTLGVNEFSARLWCGLTGLVGILLVGWVGARLFGSNAGILSAVLLASSLMYFILGHLNTLDMGLTVFLFAALGCFSLAQSAPHRSRTERTYMYGAWVAAALAFLSKGLIALVLPALTLTAYTLIEKDALPWRRLHLRGGLLLFAAICGPWLIAVSMANPEFPAFFFLHEHFARFLTDVHERDAPWWFFIPFLLMGAMPWISMAMSALFTGWRLERSPEERHAFRPRRFLILWVVVTFLFFSVSHSKLPPYILPAMPVLALLAGDFAARASGHSVRRHLLTVTALWVIVLAALWIAALIPGLSHKLPPESLSKLVGWSSGGIVIASLGAVIAWYLAGRGSPVATRNALLLAGAATFLALNAVFIGAGVLRDNRSGYELAQLVKPHVQTDTSLYTLHTYDNSLSFYLGRTFTLVNYTGELDFGEQQEPHRAIAEVEEFERAWRANHSGAVAIMPFQTFADLQNRGLPMDVIGRNRHLIAVSKPESFAAQVPSSAFAPSTR